VDSQGITQSPGCVAIHYEMNQRGAHHSAWRFAARHVEYRFLCGPSEMPLKRDTEAPPFEYACH
jgi:hypothetical protein